MVASRPGMRLRRCARRTGFEFPNPLGQKRKRAPMGPVSFLAERVGFEPTKGYKPLLVFKTSAFNRSATSPDFHVRSSRTSALTRAIPGARPPGALRASQSAFLPIGQPLCHLSQFECQRSRAGIVLAAPSRFNTRRQFSEPCPPVWVSIANRACSIVINYMKKNYEDIEIFNYL